MDNIIKIDSSYDYEPLKKKTGRSMVADLISWLGFMEIVLLSIKTHNILDLRIHNDPKCNKSML